MHKNKFYILGARRHIGRNGVPFVCKDSKCTYAQDGSLDMEEPPENPAPSRKIISMFSGAMGLDLGLESAGFKVAGCLELDAMACETIRMNKPGMPLIQDNIKNWNGAGLLEKFGIRRNELLAVVGGPPCPSFSTAGKRQAFNDPRGQVMFDFLRIVDEIHPPFFVMENVRGILSASIEHVPHADSHKLEGDAAHGSVLRLLNKTFEEMGYTVTAELVNAANYGVPQKRERVIFLGSRDGFQMTMPIGSFDSTGSLFTKKWRTIREAFLGLKEEDAEYIPYAESRAKYLRMLTAGQNWRDLPEELQKEALGGAFTSSGGRVGFFRRLSLDEPSPTVPTSPIQKSTCLCHPTKLRPLSVQEYARIQQFPDSWKFAGSIEDRYRQIGNAVPVGLGFMIGKTLLRFAENYHPVD